MKGHIKQITKSRSGKSWRVLVDERWFGAQFDSKLDAILLGSAIDFQFDSDPKYGDWITTWGPDTSQAQPVAKALPPLPPMKAPNGDRWWLPYVSNQCAHAIASGHIKGVADLKSWAIGAKAAIEAADDSEGIPF